MGKVCSCNREEEKDKNQETNLVIILFNLKQQSKQNSMLYTSGVVKTLFPSFDNNSEDKTKANFAASTSSKTSTPLFTLQKVIMIQRYIRKFLYSSKRLQIKRYREELQVS
jgi:hypothetical protein